MSPPRDEVDRLFVELCVADVAQPAPDKRAQQEPGLEAYCSALEKENDVLKAALQERKP